MKVKKYKYVGGSLIWEKFYFSVLWLNCHQRKISKTEFICRLFSVLSGVRASLIVVPVLSSHRVLENEQFGIYRQKEEKKK